MRETVIDGVLFDFDSTLTRPGSIDFHGIKQNIGCPQELTILDFIDTLSDHAARREAFETLAHNERIAADASLPADGAEELVVTLRERGYRVGVLTRNSRDSVERSLRNFERLREPDFDTIVSRDDPVAVKPDPQSVFYAAERMGVSPHRLIMVGDHHHDIAAGRDAGSWTCLVFHLVRPDWTIEVHADYEIDKLTHLWQILTEHRALPTGKLSNDLLADMLDSIRSADNRSDVKVDAAIGRDFAAFDTGSASIVVAKSDPVTFATGTPGRHLVTVNANDVICSGALPRWFLCTALLPAGTTACNVRRLLQQVDRACLDAGVALIGGHTEITEAVTRPVLCGTMFGSTTARTLRDYTPDSPSPVESTAKDASKPLAGDRILMTKSAGIEGTLILAAERQQNLLHRGVSREYIDEALNWENKLSVVPEARLALQIPGVRRLHDVTEGGVATAIRELATAARIRVRIEPQNIPVAAATLAICTALGCDPLGLIGSGSLLLVAAAATTPLLLQTLHDAGIEAQEIGAILDTREFEIVGDLPTFAVDELARLETSAD